MELSHIQLLYIQTIFDYFHEQGMWPTYGFVERKISQAHRDFDIRGVASSLPNGFGNAFSFNFDRNQEAVLRIPAIRLCKGSDEELADFVRVLQYCVDKYFSFGENNLQVTSEEVREQLKMTELSIRKVGRLIEAEGWFWSSLGRNDIEGTWVCALRPGMDGIARFDKVETIEQYLEKVDPKSFAAPAPRMPQSVEDTDILSTGNLERLLADIGYKYDETSSLEIKEDIPSAKELGRIMAAFANTEGGVIIIGMTDNFRIVGVPDGVSLESLYNEAFLSLRPHPLMNYRYANIKGMQIFIITVQKYPAPILTEDQQYYVMASKKSEPEEVLIDALSESVPSFKANILSSLEEEAHAEEAEDIGSLSQPVNIGSANMLSGSIGDIAGGEINRNTIVHETVVQKPQLDFNELLKDTIERTRDDLKTQRRERLQQAQITFIVALIVLVLSIVLVFVGVILIFTNKIQAGVVSSVASIVSGVVSGLALAFNKQTNDRLDEYARELAALEKSYTGMQYLSLITDIRMKDEAIRDLAKGISLGNQVSK